ncbi:cyclin-like protein [Calocera viscosa TUFC12733]|uniref:Cyclin-like protein n=1 Tax=Calocera viscosa (strain TUFC12733) TaxID=1330018 RepID=A0A167P7G4_CALVF|nr:cyclin-like protein [Calocera viscosa TUFC12733]
MAPSADTPVETNGASSSKKPLTLYETSTQYKHWRFSASQLEERRRRMNETAVNAIRQVHKAEEEGSSSRISFLTFDEELLLVKQYLTTIPKMCKLHQFPEEVEATAMTFLKRFYLKNTVMDWHPRNVMLTAIYLATKTTNNPMAIDTYVANIPRTTANDVLELEFLVAQSLNFQLAVWGPHRAAWGVWLDLQTLQDWGKEEARDAFAAVEGYVSASRLTDAEFIYAPSQIAAAAWHLANPALLEKWLAAKGESGALPLIKSIASLIEKEGKTPDLAVARDVDARLKICKNPEKVEGSKAYLRRQAEHEQEAAAKRQKKAERAAKALADDPFATEPINGVEQNGSKIGEVDMDDDD